MVIDSLKKNDSSMDRYLVCAWNSTGEILLPLINYELVDGIAIMTSDLSKSFSHEEAMALRDDFARRLPNRTFEIVNQNDLDSSPYLQWLRKQQ